MLVDSFLADSILQEARLFASRQFLALVPCFRLADSILLQVAICYRSPIRPPCSDVSACTKGMLLAMPKGLTHQHHHRFQPLLPLAIPMRVVVLLFDLQSLLKKLLLMLLKMLKYCLWLTWLRMSLVSYIRSLVPRILDSPLPETSTFSNTAHLLQGR